MSRGLEKITGGDKDLLDEYLFKGSTPLIIKIALGVIPEGGLDTNNTIFKRLFPNTPDAVYATSFAGKDENLDREEYLTMLSEGAYADYKKKPIEIDPNLHEKISANLKDIGIEPNDRLVGGLAITETIIRNMVKDQIKSQFDAKSKPTEKPVEFAPNGEAVNPNDTPKIELSEDPSNVPLGNEANVTTPSMGMGSP